jgi:hypothetical protein
MFGPIARKLRSREAEVLGWRSAGDKRARVMLLKSDLRSLREQNGTGDYRSRADTDYSLQKV